MKAKILPLNGKYYGTRIVITDDNEHEYEITLWNCAEHEPSDRELDGVCTIEEWRRNKPIYSEQDGMAYMARDIVEVCDSHFESRATYALAQKLVGLINNETDPMPQ